MSIYIEDVEEGGYYLTDGNQLRRVEAISSDDEGRLRVRFRAKSDLIPNRPFGPGSTMTVGSQPLLLTFAENCTSRLSEADVADRRARQIILEGE